MYTLALHSEEVLERKRKKSYTHLVRNLGLCSVKLAKNLGLYLKVAAKKSKAVFSGGIFSATGNTAEDYLVTGNLSVLNSDVKGSEDINSKDDNPAERAGKILDKYGNNILRTAYSYLHNMSDAEDILQDTLIQYIRKAPAFENDNHEKAWLLTVAANLSKNKLEYLGIRKTDELSEELVSENKEDLEGYSTKEISNILKRNEATVRSDLNRGRQQLKNILKEAYDFE